MAAHLLTDPANPLRLPFPDIARVLLASFATSVPHDQPIRRTANFERLSGMAMAFGMLHMQQENMHLAPAMERGLALLTTYVDPAVRLGWDRLAVEIIAFARSCDEKVAQLEREAAEGIAIAAAIPPVPKQ